MSKSDFDWIVVGAGYSGATFAERLASVVKAKVLVIDRRSHVGGNSYDEVDSSGVLFHMYGPHIFHTKSERVWKYLSKFVSWRPYRHQVLAKVEGFLVPLPFNFDSIETLYPSYQAKRLVAELTSAYGFGTYVPILTLLESTSKSVRELAFQIYEWIFLGYNQKQWASRPEDLDRSVTGRVPVAMSYNRYYFTDRFQAIPSAGYHSLFEKMLQHPSITVALNTEFSDVGHLCEGKVYFTGRVDELLGYELGVLPYRSVEFHHKSAKATQILPVAQVNFPNLNDGPYTRVTEHKQLTGQDTDITKLTYELPCDYVHGFNEPYYPIPKPDNRELHGRYLGQVRLRYPEMMVGGRLGDYRYYNMDQAVLSALIRFDHMRSGTLTKAESQGQVT